MDRHLKAYLFDIQTSIDEIYSFFESVPKRFDEYGRNLMLRRAIERNVSIIGEAVEVKENILKFRFVREWCSFTHEYILW